MFLGAKILLLGRVESQCLLNDGFFGWLPSVILLNFDGTLSITSNQFEGLCFRSNLAQLLVATHDDNILDSSYFLEILGKLKCIFSSPQTFKLSSGEPKVRITYSSLSHELFTWYFKLLSVIRLQTHLTQPPAGQQLYCWYLIHQRQRDSPVGWLKWVLVQF